MDHPGVRLLSPDDSHIVILTGRGSKAVHNDIRSLIDMIGRASSAAQGLAHVITTYAAFSGSDNTMYILLDESNRQVVGFTKVGNRKLFLWDRAGKQHERTLLCLLDFFTFPECQRRGNGKKMIDRMLEHQHLQMRQVPIDRPSALCLSFMSRQFGLTDYIPQANRFVVFDEFWDEQVRPRGLLTPTRARPWLVQPLPSMRTPQRRPLQQFNPITWAQY
jgi:alpha-tubulin N-acetyltransferase 1